MYKFYPGLYIDDAVRNPEALTAMLSAGTAVFNVYVVCACPKRYGAAQIFCATQLFSPVHKGVDFIIIGIAEGKYAAFRLLRAITEDYLAAGNSLERFGEYYLHESRNVNWEGGGKP